jgi:hypothetical protein
MNKLIIVAMAAGMSIAAPIASNAATVAATTAAAATTTASTMLSGTSTFSDVTGRLSGSSTANVDLSSSAKLTNFQIVKLSSLKGYKAGMKVTTAEMTSMTALDAKVTANAALTAKLKAAGYTPNDVVAVSSDATGGMTVFVNK